MDEDDVRRQVEEAVEEERRKWEKVVASQNQAEEATSKQVAHLTAQLQEIREQQKEHAEKVEQEVAERIEKHVKELTDKHSDEMKKVRLECLTREKASIGRIREDSSRALLVERQANEATIMSLGEAEDERVRKKVAQAKASFEKQLQEKEQELKAAGQRIAELEKMVPTDGPNSENLRETVKRERKRTRQAEKQLESAAAEIEQLKQKLLDSKQLHYQGSLENVARAPPETAKLYRQMEQYKNEAKMLRQQLDAQMPGKLFELQSNMKMNTEERDKLKEEVKTLQQILSRQERVIQANKEQDSEHAQKVQVVYGDLQVAKAETLRLKEKLEVAEKGLVSRQKIEEGLRTRAEKAEKRCKAIEGRLREELEGMKRKCLGLEAARESDRKQGQGKLKEKERLLKNLQELCSKEKLEVEAKALEVRALTVQIQDLKREAGLKPKKQNIEIPGGREGGKEGEKRGQPAISPQPGGSAHASNNTPAPAAPRVPSLAIESSKDVSASAPKTMDAKKEGKGKLPTSLAEMAESHTPSNRTEHRPPSSSVQTARRASSSSRQKPRSRGGAARINSGMEKLDAADGALADETGDCTATFASINDPDDPDTDPDPTIPDPDDHDDDEAATTPGEEEDGEEELDHPEDDSYWQDAQFEEEEEVLEAEADDHEVGEV